MNNDVFEKLMKKTASLLGNDNYELEDCNNALIGLDDTLLSFQYLSEADQVLLYANILELPKQKLEAFYQKLLEGQFFFNKTQGFTLAINKDFDIVLLQAIIPMRTVDENTLLQIMENFMNVADYWREELKSFYEDNTSHEKEFTPTPTDTMLRV